MGIAYFVKKLIFGHTVDSESYIKYLRKQGISIGENTVIYEPRMSCIDITRPYLIKIGNNVKITRGVTVLTHGYDWSVLSCKNDVVLGSGGAVNIGDNVFIGMNSTILKGVTIGNNVIIGANSLVNKDIPDNSVAAGNPAKVIMSVDEYYEKRLAEQKKEAFEVYNKYVEAYGQEPKEEVFDEFFFLFQKRNEKLNPSFERQMKWNGNYYEILNNFKNTEPEFNGFDEFIKTAKQSKNQRNAQ